MSKLDLETTKRLVKEAVDAHPGRVNPKMEGMTVCAYSNRSGTVHCIAGQVLKDFGLPVPNYESYNNTVGIETLVEDDALAGTITGDALQYLRVAQYVFDGGDVSGGAPRRWSRAYQMLNDNYDKYLAEVMA